MKLVIFTEKYGDLGNRLFRFGRLYTSKPKSILALDLSLCQYTHLYEPHRIGFNVLFKLLTLFRRPILELLCGRISAISEARKLAVFAPGCLETPAPNWKTVLRDIETAKGCIFRLDRRAFFYKCGKLHDAERRPRLQQIFALKSKHRMAASKFLRNRLPGSILVAVHIRRGDYRIFENGRWFFSDEVYLRSMENLAQTRPDNCSVVFILIGDEHIDPKNFASVNVLYFGPAGVGVDQALLEASDAILGPESTFSAWPSFLHRIPRAVISSPSHTARWEDFRPADIDAGL